MRGMVRAGAMLVLLLVWLSVPGRCEEKEWSALILQPLEDGSVYVSLHIKGGVPAEFDPRTALMAVFGEETRFLKTERTEGDYRMTAQVPGKVPRRGLERSGEWSLQPVQELFAHLHGPVYCFVVCPKGVPILQATVDAIPLRPVKNYDQLFLRLDPVPRAPVLRFRMACPVETLQALALVLLLPVAVLLLLNRSIPSGPSAWFRYSQACDVLSTGGMVLYLLTAWLLHAPFVGVLILPDWLPVGQAIYALEAYGTLLLPIGLMHLSLAALSHRVRVQLRSMTLTRGELVVHEFWTIVGRFVPFVLFMAALNDCYGGQWAGALIYVLSGLAVYRISFFRQLSIEGPVRRLTGGPLFEQVSRIARSAGIVVRRIYLVSTMRRKIAGSAATVGNTLIVADWLLHELSCREVDSILAREVAHMKKRHPLRIALALLAAFLSQMLSHYTAPGALDRDGKIWMAFICYGLAYLGALALARRFERTADDLGATLTEDPASLISALRSLSRSNLTPLQWGIWSQWTMRRPSVQDRVAALATRAGILPEPSHDSTNCETSHYRLEDMVML